jgi:hypothetical protein
LREIKWGDWVFVIETDKKNRQKPIQTKTHTEKHKKLIVDNQLNGSQYRIYYSEQHTIEDDYSN